MRNRHLLGWKLVIPGSGRPMDAGGDCRDCHAHRDRASSIADRNVHGDRDAYIDSDAITHGHSHLDAVVHANTKPNSRIGGLGQRRQAQRPQRAGPGLPYRHGVASWIDAACRGAEQ